MNIKTDGEGTFKNVELGDLFYCEKYHQYYIVIEDDIEDYYYLQEMSGSLNLFGNERYNSIRALTRGLNSKQDLQLVHYSKHHYELELKKK